MRTDTIFALDARTATPHYPGIGRYVRSLSAELTPLLEDGERLALILNRDQEELAQRFTGKKRVSISYAAASNFNIRQQRELPSLLDKAGAHLYHSPYYLMPYRPGRPCILTLYDLIPLLYPEYVSPRARFLFRWMTNLALRAATEVIAISNTTRADLIRVFGVHPERVSVIPLAAAPKFQPSSQSTIERVCRGYSLTKGYILYFGINKPHKNLERLVEAWAPIAVRTKSQARSLQLVIAGAWNPLYDGPRQRAEALGISDRVRFLGPIPEADLLGLYGGALAFVFPSLYEGFGLPVLEAMACGVPVACADRSSLTEIARGWAALFDPTSTQEMTDTLIHLIENPAYRTELRERGLERAADFSWHRTALTTIEIYRRHAGRL